MKTVQEVIDKLRVRYRRVWVGELVHPGSSTWPYAVSLASLTKGELERDFARIEWHLMELASWARKAGLSVEERARKVGRVSYHLPARVVAPDICSLAKAAGRSDHLSCFEVRLAHLREAFPQVSNGDLGNCLQWLDTLDADEASFDLVCRAATWFATHDARGLTARQVPLVGFHAKWLDNRCRLQLAKTLAGKPDIVLKERPRHLRFRYLDPAYLASGSRVFDSFTEGDVVDPAYAPEAVVICENRDSALWFGAVDKGIAILGDGMAGTASVAKVSWVRSAAHVIYWGDMDIAGFDILVRYREMGLDVASILMNSAAFAAYERYGTNVDKQGRKLRARPAAEASPWLTEEENELYLELCSEAHSGPRRVEQERIPLPCALEEVLRLVD